VKLVEAFLPGAPRGSRARSAAGLGDFDTGNRRTRSS